MSTLLFVGLVDQQLLKLVKGLLALRAMIMNPSHSNDTVQRTQQAGQLWIQLAKRYSAQNSSIKLVVPNFHIVIELLLRVLPAVRDMRLGLTTRFEAEHSQNKKLVVRVKHNQDAMPENYAIQMRVMPNSLTYLFSGVSEVRTCQKSLVKYLGVISMYHLRMHGNQLGGSRTLAMFHERTRY